MLSLINKTKAILFTTFVTAAYFIRRAKRRKEEKRWANMTFEKMGEELLQEFIQNGFSDKEKTLARKIRFFAEKHNLKL